MSYMERKGPWIRYPKEKCPECGEELIEFDVMFSDIIVTECFCLGEECDYKSTTGLDIDKEIKE